MSSANQVGQLDNNTTCVSNAIVPCACTMTSMIELVYLEVVPPIWRLKCNDSAKVYPIFLVPVISTITRFI